MRIVFYWTSSNLTLIVGRICIIIKHEGHEDIHTNGGYGNVKGI